MESIIQELTDKLAAANKEIEKLNKCLQWVNEPLKEGETKEHISSNYRLMLLYQVQDENEIEDLLKPYLSEYELYGDSYGVPTIVDKVESAIKNLKLDQTRLDILEKSQARLSAIGPSMDGKNWHVNAKINGSWKMIYGNTIREICDRLLEIQNA